jgi:hypothetical protein
VTRSSCSIRFASFLFGVKKSACSPVVGNLKCIAFLTSLTYPSIFSQIAMFSPHSDHTVLEKFETRSSCSIRFASFLFGVKKSACSPVVGNLKSTSSLPIVLTSLTYPSIFSQIAMFSPHSDHTVLEKFETCKLNEVRKAILPAKLSPINNLEFPTLYVGNV